LVATIRRSSFGIRKKPEGLIDIVLKLALAGFKLFDALLDGNDDLARHLTGQPFIDLSIGPCEERKGR
jgi:hypothetical protein